MGIAIMFQPDSIKCNGSVMSCGIGLRWAKEFVKMCNSYFINKAVENDPTMFIKNQVNKYRQ